MDTQARIDKLGTEIKTLTNVRHDIVNKYYDILESLDDVGGIIRNNLDLISVTGHPSKQFDRMQAIALDSIKVLDSEISRVMLNHIRARRDAINHMISQEK